LPESILYPLFSTDFLKSEGVFQEEIPYLRETQDQLLISYEQLKDFEILDGLTYKDLFLIKRLFSFLGLAYFDLLSKKTKTEYYEASIPFLSPKTLEVLLGSLIEKQKVPLFIKAFSYSNDSKKTFDIQYQPLIKGTDHYLFPYNVFTSANVFRNILFPLNKRLFKGLNFDPIADLLEKSFIELGFKTRKNQKIFYKGKESDIDLMIWKKNIIFIFECKNSVLPVNAYEIRAPYEQLEKAAFKQLPLSTTACRDREFLKKYSIDIDNTENDFEVHGCIVTSNKLLVGYHMNDFPIRDQAALIKFVEKGRKIFVDGDKETLFSLWRDNEFTPEDLVNFLSSDYVYYKSLTDAQFEHKVSYDIGNAQIDLLIYPLNMEQFKKSFNNSSLKYSEY